VNLRFGEFLLRNGRVNYTDNFIKPNFSARLNSINGRVGAFGTESTTPADVKLDAQIDSNGPVTISGTVNPLAKVPSLDLSAKASDVELTSFTPYSTKYAGYPIESGQLSVDLHYLLNESKLTANNHLVIDQLTFGKHVDSPTATKLPVTLAIALLKDSNGKIDVQIPVSGSLSDPQFSVGGLIWGAVLNLIKKAITAPFTLLASAFGGSQDLEYVGFDPGSATLTPAALGKLDTLSKALKDKPAVKLELVGHADAARDTPALKAALVEHSVRQEKIKDVVGKGTSVAIEDVKVSPDEYDKYLTRAYKDADFKKQRNLVGFTKTLPPAEMKKLLAENLTPPASGLTDLARARAQAVRSWLAGKVDPARVSSRAGGLVAGDEKKAGTDSAKGAMPSTRVDFVLR
jgi:outer membrane protein OmpA-like peptidoglycan-associated protein